MTNKLELTLENDLYDKQYDAIFNDSRYSIIEASTKSGKTKPHHKLVISGG